MSWLMAEQDESKEMYLLGLSWWKKKQYSNALFCFQKAHEIQPDNPSILSQLGLAKVKMKAAQEGIELCKRAVRKKPFDDDLVFNLGQACLFAGERAEARKAFLLGAKGCEDHRRFVKALKEMGVRRNPVISFLSRDHVLNRWLGKLTYRPGTFRIQDLEN
jgi:tetratricopeptide (TPR) repeat protein